MTDPYPPSNATLMPAIEHRVDVTHDMEGEVEQVYNHLIYAFGEPLSVTARAYLDEIGTVSIPTGTPDAAILDYLQERYARINRLTRKGYVTIWTA